MHELIINNKRIDDWAIVSQVEYSPFSIVNLYKERADNYPSFFGTSRTNKLIKISLVLKNRCQDYLNLQEDLENKILTEIKSDSPSWIELDNRYFYGILEDVEISKMYQGSATITLNNIYGKWFSKKITKKLGESFYLKGVEETDVAIINLIPTTTNPKIHYKDKSISIENALVQRNISINLSDKTVKQLGEHLAINIDSDFF